MKKTRKQLARDALLLRATGYDATETVEEYADKDGEMVLLKRRVATKNVPPDVSAAKIIMEEQDFSVSDMTDEQLEKERARLIKELKKTEKKVYTVGRLKKETKSRILEERTKSGIKNKRVTKEEIKKRIDDYSWVHGFIEEHTAEIYEYEELHDAVKRQTKLTSSEVDKLRELKERLERGEKLKEYNPFDSFPPDE